MNNSVIETTVMPIIRHGVTALGMFMAGAGFTGTTVELVTGIILAIAPVIMSVYSKRKAAV